MNARNPIVQESVSGTLNEIVHSLQYLSKSLPCPESENENGNVTHEFTKNEIAGLRNLIDCAQAATEACYEQHLVESRAIAATATPISTD